jgi:hypothetical protein
MTQSRVFVAGATGLRSRDFFHPAGVLANGSIERTGDPAAARLGRDLEQAVGGRDEQGRLGAVIGFTYAMPTVLRGPLLKFINKSIHLFVRDRRLDWDFHIDDTPRDQWTVQGIPLLDSGSDEEKCWIRENRHSKLQPSGVIRTANALTRTGVRIAESGAPRTPRSRGRLISGCWRLAAR